MGRMLTRPCGVQSGNATQPLAGSTQPGHLSAYRLDWHDPREVTRKL